MKWIFLCALLIIAVPAWAQLVAAKNVIAQPSENELWNQKECPQGLEDLGNLLTINPYDSKGRCFNYVGRLVQLLSKNEALFSFMNDSTPFSLVNFGKGSVPIAPFYGVVKGKEAYSYQTVSAGKKIIHSFVVVPKSKDREAWELKRAERNMVEQEKKRAAERENAEQELKQIKDLKEAELIASAECTKKIRMDPLIYIDPSSGLMWARNGNIANKGMSWDDAMGWVKKLNYVSCNDWRLPTKEELETFAKRGGIRPFEWYNANGFNNVQDDVYWTSTSSTLAWGVFMYEFSASEYYKTSWKKVWPVRGTK